LLKFAKKAMQFYNQEVEKQMYLYFSGLPEKSKRHYAAVEATKLGRGGQSYISKLFSISRARIRDGQRELGNPELLKTIPEGKQRRAGGGAD